ncbi:hypothetical protein [Actomonas aquatica]|uniref:Glycine zipper 2TM domain-containing protein n=1 Tax=Actomonas aquatica TaxID=2866162 RepID=A0ABZ1C9N8_9BACT|nr:hypothetical protein [Opitutus sp. WL0086]WRQ88360.1 hypothetical protein K1X11_003020 [Opitutus sp. WL0086]
MFKTDPRRARGLALGLAATVVALAGAGCESTTGNSSSGKASASNQAASPMVARTVTDEEAAHRARLAEEHWDGRGTKKVDFGRVVESRPVTIDGTNTGYGTMGGALTGAIAARPKTAAPKDLVVAVAGTVTGAVAGRKYEEMMTMREGQEVMVRLEDGSIVVVTQGAEDGFFETGDVVKIVHGERGAYVSLTNPDERATIKTAEAKRRATGAWYEGPTGADQRGNP